LFYGWFVVAGASLVWFISTGTFMHSYGVFLPVMSETFGWSRAATAAGLTIGLLTFGLSSPLAGISINRFGPRKNIVLGNSAAALGMFGMSQCRELWQLYILFGIMIGLGAGFGLYVACTTLIHNWFDDRKPLALGFVVTAGSLAGFVFPPLTSWLIDTVGLQLTWIVYGSMILVFAVVIGGLVLIRNTPAEKGLVPLGQTNGGETTGARIQSPTDDAQYLTGDADSPNMQVKQLTRKPTFWIIILIGCATFYALGSMSAHQIAYLKDTGFTVIVAALVYSVFSAMGIIGRLGFGALAQYISLRKLLFICFVLQIGAFVILLTPRSSGFVYLYAILLGIGSGGIVAAFPTLVGEYSGRTRYTQIMGIALMLAIIAQSCGPLVTGAIYDFNTNYTIAFILIIVFLLLGLIGTLFLRASNHHSPSP